MRSSEGSGGLDEVTFKGPFQPELCHDSVVSQHILERLEMASLLVSY